MKIEWNKVTWYSKLLALALLVLLPFIGFYFGVQYEKNISSIKLSESPQLRPGQIVGGDKDIHGCIGSAGYSWCEAKQKCLRIWEETCETPPSSLNLQAFKDAKPQGCADKTNKAYLIQNKMVLTVREGNCPDNSYFFGLYGKTPQEIFCTSHDSIAGPMEKCSSAQYQETFDNLLKIYSQFNGNLEINSIIPAERIY